MRTPWSVGSVLLAFALVLAGFLPFAGEVRAATPSESDIPGVPLPGAVVTGQLGGPIYDVVYRVDVPAGYVLVAGLAGTPGTDFDMYLFDASAITVIGTHGLLAKSIGPTSDEQVSWPTRIGSTFYLDLNGASDQEGSYTLSVQIVPDATPPTAVLVVANGITRVSAPEVTLQLAGFDDISGVTEMLLSNDGVNFLPPVPFRNQFDWRLSPGDGLKTIWVSVINGVGLPSVPASVSVLLDAASPTVLAVTPADGTTVTTARPTISVQFSEPREAATRT